MHNIFDSSENYLEAIYVLGERKEGKNGQVHSIDLANFLDVSRASVSNAMKKLEEDGKVIMRHDGALELTEAGRAIGKEINDRHQTVRKVLIHIGVSPETADDDACKIEHALSQETFDCIKKAVEAREENC